MTHVEAMWSVKPGRDLHRIEQLEARYSYAAMQADPVLQSVCAVMAEVGEAFGTEGASDTREFRLVGAVLAALEAGGEPLLLLRYFEFWTLHLHGLLGGSRECVSCGSAIEPGTAKSLSPDGGFHCGGCAESRGGASTHLSRQEAVWIDRLQCTAPDELPASAGIARPGGRLERLFRGQLETFAERRFRSYRHVRTLAGVREERS
jgi:DNA repair protein RecO